MQTTRPTLRWRLAQWLEFRWWQAYLRSRTPEKYLAEKREYWQRFLQQIQWPVVPGQRVLDAGCGPAGIFVLLRDRQRVTALDPLLNNYEQLQIFARKDYPEVAFDATPLEGYRTDRAFDSIYCLNAINHVSNWPASLDALTAAARPGTRLVISSDVHRHAYLLPLFRALPGDALHPQQHPAVDYRGALTIRGWMIEREVVLRSELIFEYRAWVATLS